MTETIQTPHVTKKFGRTLENLEMLWFLRDQAERRLTAHINGVGMNADVYAAANTSDEAWDTQAEGYTPPPAMWRVYKEEYFAEFRHLANLVQISHRNVRIATGHEKIGNMACRS